MTMTKSATSHLLPVFARVDLGFERGEGAWLIATDGELYGHHQKFRDLFLHRLEDIYYAEQQLKRSRR